MPKLCAQLLGEQELLVCVPRALEIDHLPVENDHAVRIDRRHPVLAWARCLPAKLVVSKLRLRWVPFFWRENAPRVSIGTKQSS